MLQISNRFKKTIVAATILVSSVENSFAEEVKTGNLDNLKITSSIQLNTKTGLASMKINSIEDS